MSGLSPKPDQVAFFENSDELRAWLEVNHDKAPELWVGMYRRGTGKPSITWPEVVDQALCFGWIDGIRQGLDATSYANRLTPRRRGSTWSARNIQRLEELSRLSLVRPGGKAAFEARDEKRSRIYSYENRALDLDPKRAALFRADQPAWKFFESQPPSYRKTALYWVASPKREDTKDRRLKILIESSRNQKRVPPHAP